MKYLKVFSIAAVTFFLFCCKGEATSRENQGLNLDKKDFNILLITLDTLRVDRLSIYSDKHLTTSNIDRLAKRSFIFRRAFSHNPVTLPAHIFNNCRILKRKAIWNRGFYRGFSS